MEKTWEPDSEVSGCKELRADICDDSVSFTRFSRPREVELTTQSRDRRKKTIEMIPIDFIYQMRQSNGLDSIGWHGAGFLDGKLQYTGFASYNDEGIISADQNNFVGREVKDTKGLREAIKAYYKESLPQFREAVEALPRDMSDIAKKLLLE